MRAIAVIPARLASTRLPRKMLREIAGKPLVGAVYDAVRSSPLLDDVIIATDSDEILKVCRRNGWNHFPDHWQYVADGTNDPARVLREIPLDRLVARLR